MCYMSFLSNSVANLKNYFNINKITNCSFKLNYDDLHARMHYYMLSRTKFNVGVLQSIAAHVLYVSLL